MLRIGTFSEQDTVVQISGCSFDIHVHDIVGTLISGASLIMLQPGGLLDLVYLARVIGSKSISYMHMVPSLLNSFFEFIIKNKLVYILASLHSVCSSGESFRIIINVPNICVSIFFR